VRCGHAAAACQPSTQHLALRIRSSDKLALSSIFFELASGFQGTRRVRGYDGTMRVQGYDLC
jgi:hypothetical protein